jgi:hypothetical protein
MLIIGHGLIVSGVTGRAGGQTFRTRSLRGRSSIATVPRDYHLAQPPDPDKPHKCPCECWSLADTAWLAMTDDEHAIWNAAVTARGISGYDLWMKEALYLCNQGLYLPDGPGPGGGFTPRQAIPGTHIPPPASCLPEPPPGCQYCPGQEPRDWIRVEIQGVTGPCAALNGEYEVPYFQGCMFRRGSPYIHVEIVSPFSIEALAQLTPSDVIWFRRDELEDACAFTEQVPAFAATGQCQACITDAYLWITPYAMFGAG